LEASTWQSDRFKSKQLRKLTWSKTPPLVSHDCAQLTVSGRILTNIESEHANELNVTVHPLMKKIVTQLHRFTSYDLRSNLTDPPAAEVGDIVCLLKGCPALVYLHPIKGTQTYRITAKYSKLQDIAAKHLIRDLIIFDRERSFCWTEAQKTAVPTGVRSSENRWGFRNLKDIDAIPEVLLTIV